MNKEEILIYDLKSIPENFTGLTPEYVFKIYKQERIVLWDSSNGGAEPKIIDVDEDLPHAFVVDVSSTQLSENTMEKINKVSNNEAGE